jgi:hypothetical protein
VTLMPAGINLHKWPLVSILWSSFSRNLRTKQIPKMFKIL